MEEDAFKTITEHDCPLLQTIIRIEAIYSAPLSSLGLVDVYAHAYLLSDRNLYASRLAAERFDLRQKRKNNNNKPLFTPN